MSQRLDACEEINRDKSNSVFSLCRAFLRFGDLCLRGSHGRIEPGDGRRPVRMPRRSGLREDCRDDAVRPGVPAGVREYRFDYVMCYSVWGPKFVFQHEQQKRGIK
jgi:hypothetical protein